MLVHLSGGRKARIEPTLMIFKNKTRSYQMTGLLDDVPGVGYRSGPRRWMDTTIMKECLQEPRVIKKLPHNHVRHLFVGNCSGQNLDDEIVAFAEDILTTINFFSFQCNGSGPVERFVYHPEDIGRMPSKMGRL